MNRIPLSSAAHAAALVAVGFRRDGLRIESLKHTGTGESAVCWHYEGQDAPDAADLLRRSKPEHPKALWREDAAHPFLAALTGALNYDQLCDWHCNPEKGICAQFWPGNRLVKVQTGTLAYDQDALQNTPVKYGFQTPELVLAAALATCGFLPRPGLTASAAIGFPLTSVIYPEVDAPAAVGAAKAMRATVATPFHMPGPFAAGMHPFQYAFSAAANLSTVPAVVASVERKPVFFFKGAKSALATQAALSRPGFEGKLRDHIAGV